MIKNGLFLLLSLCLSSSVYAGFPKNDLHLQDQMFRFFQTMTEERFNEIIDEVVTVYAPILSAHGKELNVLRSWEDPTVNAYANQSGNVWNVAMFGGLARRPEVTEDGFALVVCHELGHHLAGFPFYGDGDWAASEGQSDYFASQVCARKVWGTEHEKNASLAPEVHPVAKTQCDQAWDDLDDRHLCYRIAMAGYSLADLLGALGGTQVSFETPDKKELPNTQTSHPAGQCRLDTYFSGALCARDFAESVIPGKEHPNGQTSLEAEEVASAYSCMKPDFYDLGSRPRCWFKPNRESMIGVDQTSWKETYGNGNSIMEPGEAWEMTSTLINRTGFSYEDFLVRFKVSDPNIVPIRGLSEHRRLKPFSVSEQSDPFLIYFEPDLACGSEIDFNVGVDLQGRKGKLPLKNSIGVLHASDTSVVAPALKIPEVERKGVMSAIWISEPQAAVYAKVHVNMIHSYIGDIKLTLLSPNGEEFLVREPHGGSADNLNETFRVRINQKDVQGIWGLRVIDIMSPDGGELQEWSLQFEEANCEIPQRDFQLSFLD